MRRMTRAVPALVLLAAAGAAAQQAPAPTATTVPSAPSTTAAPPAEPQRLGRPMPGNVPPLTTPRVRREPPDVYVSAVSPSESRFANRLRSGRGGRGRGSGTMGAPGVAAGAPRTMDDADDEGLR